MSEIRVDRIQANEGTISFTGITTFSGSGAFGLPGGGSLKRPEVPKEGQVRYIDGDVKKGLEFYNGTEWITVGVANGSVPEGTTPIGVFGGGRIGSPSTPPITNTIDYVTISTTGNASDFGDLSQSIEGTVACSSSTRGVFGGGETPTIVNTIDYITIATTGNATTFGQLTQIKDALGSCSSSTRGVFGSGVLGGPTTSGTTVVIEYLTIATTGNALDFGDLIEAKYFASACSSSIRGVFGGGIIEGFVSTNTLEYITIATTGNAQLSGNLTKDQGLTNNGALSNNHGGLL
jgi:hypothetical protein